MVSAEIDQAQEAAWNRWYDEVHLPAALACPGVLSGTRYRSTRDASLTDHGSTDTDSAIVYITVYTLENPQAIDTPEFQAMRGWYQFKEHIRARTQVFSQKFSRNHDDTTGQ